MSPFGSFLAAAVLLMLNTRFVPSLRSNIAGPQAASGTSPEASLQAKLRSNIENYTVNAANLLQASAKFSDDFQVPMGIEWQLSSVPYKPIRLQFSNTTVLQILRGIVAVEPGYAFNTDNGVVHLGKTTITDDPRNLLNLRIKDFDLSSEYVFHANNRLRQLVVDLTNPSLPKHDAGCAGSYGVGAGDQKATFHLRDATVRNILDRFVTAAGFNIWLATFPEIPEADADDFFKSTSIFSPDLPRTNLPAWDLLLPGYDPVRKQIGVGWKQRKDWPKKPSTKILNDLVN